MTTHHRAALWLALALMAAVLVLMVTDERPAPDVDVYVPMTASEAVLFTEEP